MAREKVKPPPSTTSVPIVKPPKQEVNQTPISANTELKPFIPEPTTVPPPDNQPKVTKGPLDDILPYLGVAGVILVVALMMKKRK